jgi:hypothetical protein
VEGEGAGVGGEKVGKKVENGRAQYIAPANIAMKMSTRNT